MTTDRLFGLGGRVAAIIGAGSGIGEAVARGCGQQGATVRCLDVDGDAAAPSTTPSIKSSTSTARWTS